MSRLTSRVDQFAMDFARLVIRRRLLTIAIILVATLAVAANMVNLSISNNYRVFFSSDNPELNTFEEFQATYTKNDNFLFVLIPSSGDAFDDETLDAVDALTEAAWQLPYALRVDSLANFQYTRAEDDDFIVEDLFAGPADLTDRQIAHRRDVALSEPTVAGQLVTKDGSAAAVNVVIQFPEVAADEVTEAALAARALRDEFRERYPEMGVYLTGVAMLNNAIIESSLDDAAALVPFMYLVVLLASVIVLRSFSAVGAMLGVITCSVLVAMGAGGLMAVELTGISLAAPTVIITLAVADSIHILISFRNALRAGLSKNDALVEAMRVNLLAVTITSLTTCVGFLTLNFSDAPPFDHLGNMTAAGIFAAWICSLTILPAMISLLPHRVPAPKKGSGPSVMSRLADLVIARYRLFLGGMAALVAGLLAFIPTIEFNDQWVRYFDERVEFRTDSDAALEYFGLYPIEFSVPAGVSNGIADPDFLRKVDDFAVWLRAQPHVEHVYALPDIMKRLSRDMNGGGEDFYRLPEDKALAAQYLLLYELSLPYRLDLNDRIDIDKSATRVTATLADVTTKETKAFLRAAEAYIVDNFPPEQRATPTSAQVMFTYITDRNVEDMIQGTAIAIFAISLILIGALRSPALGLFALIPNALPILVTFGIWALLVGQVGLSIASVASISIGIVVDDTVHFLAKYQRARREHGYDVETAIRYAFETVGPALVVTTAILSLGFAVLTYSSFKLNADMGLMTLIAIVLALAFDFFLLPPLLIAGSRIRKRIDGRDAAAQPQPS